MLTLPKTHKDRYYAKPIAIEYTYRLDDEVSEGSDYHTLYEILGNATELDDVNLIISNFGGNLDTCIAIVNAIRSCKGQVNGILAGVAYSAAGCIFLSCHTHTVQDHTGLMAHDAQGVEGGSISKAKLRLDHTKKIVNSLYQDVFRYFFTEQEITDIVENDKEFWLTSDEIVERIISRNEKLTKEYEEELENETPPSFEDLMKLSRKELIKFILPEDAIPDK